MKRIIAMLFYGGLGLITACMAFLIMVMLNDHVYGIITSLLGSLAGAQAILGFTGKRTLTKRDGKIIIWIGAIYGTLGVLLPYMIFASTFDPIDFLFIFLGMLGGIEVAKLVYPKLAGKEVGERPHVITKGIDPKVRRAILLFKVRPILVSYLYAIILISMLSYFVSDTIGISWTLLGIFIVYEAIAKRIFTITESDMERYEINSRIKAAKHK
jgi:hypothetical protein